MFQVIYLTVISVRISKLNTAIEKYRDLLQQEVNDHKSSINARNMSRSFDELPEGIKSLSTGGSSHLVSG